MNCKKGDLAIVKTTHPLERIHGVLVECLEHSIHKAQGEVWYCRFLGSPKIDDDGVLTQVGWIPDKHLRPLRGDREEEPHAEALTA